MRSLTTCGARPLVLLLGAALTLSPLLARAQTPPVPPTPTEGKRTAPVKITAADAQTLASALRSVSQQAGVAFVVEGKAFRARNSPPPLATVVAKWPEAGLPLDKTVQEIAATYDYQAVREGGVFLLTKRYTNADDLPDVTAEELRLALRDASQAASALPAPTIPPTDILSEKDPFAWTLYQTLTPAQKKKLVDPTNALFIAELNANQ